MNDCPMCKGQRFLVTENEVVDCECIRRERTLNLYKSAGIPLEFIDANIDMFWPREDAHHDTLSEGDSEHKTKVREAVIGFMGQIPSLIEGKPFALRVKKKNATTPTEMKGRHLALSGGYKSGKSLLAAIIAKESMRHSIKPLILEWASIIDSCFDFDGGEVFEQMELLFATKKILVIENVDLTYQPQMKANRGEPGKISPFALRKLDLLFSQRKSRMLPVVFTTSDDPLEFLKMPYGPILKSVLNETVVLTLPSPPEKKIEEEIQERIY